MATQTWTEERIRELLHEVKDPEIPVISLEELGVLRKVEVTDNEIVITITPTYSGCPAMTVMEEDICKVLEKNGITNYKVNTVLSPAWTTDWIPEKAKERLRAYGIHPPAEASVDKAALLGKVRQLTCPNCGSDNTRMKSQFGSTACKALFVCQACKEPFDYFKCI